MKKEQLFGFLKNHEKELENVTEDEFYSYLYNNILRVEDDIKVNVLNSYSNENETKILTPDNHKLGFMSQVWDTLSPENKAKLIYWQINQLTKENNLPVVNKLFTKNMENVASYSFSNDITLNFNILIEKNCHSQSVGPNVYSTIVHEMKHCYDMCVMSEQIEESENDTLSKYVDYIRYKQNGQKIIGNSYFGSNPEDDINDLCATYIKTKEDKEIIDYLLLNTYSNFPCERTAYKLQNLNMDNLIKENREYAIRKDIDNLKLKKRYYDCYLSEDATLCDLYDLNILCSYDKSVLNALKAISISIVYKDDDKLIQHMPEYFLRIFCFPNIIQNLTKAFEGILDNEDFNKYKNVIKTLEDNHDEQSILKYIEYLTTVFSKKLLSNANQYGKELYFQFNEIKQSISVK